MSISAPRTDRPARLILVPIAVLLLAAGSSGSVAPGNRKAYCRGEVAGQYGTKPMYVTTGKLIRGEKGATSVSGTVDKGSEGIKKFRCRFDSKGRFIDVMALTPDGE